MQVFNAINYLVKKTAGLTLWKALAADDVVEHLSTVKVIAAVT
jgi:hypothetical protein